MAKAARAVPEGFHTITPQLALDNAAETIDWYKRAFGAEEISRGLGPDGKIMHAELKIGDSRFMVNDVIEVIPLAFMRGRTLNDSVIILDEAQNTTPSQMLMFLTRLGHDSKMIVTGDASQVDLPDGTRSGLNDAVDKLRGIKGIGLVELEKSDIVRHRLVQNIVNAYERSDDDRRS